MKSDLATERRKLRTREAARFTGLGKSTLDKLRLTGGGPAYLKVGRTVLYDPDDLNAWLAMHRRTSSSANAG